MRYAIERVRVVICKAPSFWPWKNSGVSVLTLAEHYSFIADSVVCKTLENIVEANIVKQESRLSLKWHSEGIRFYTLANLSCQSDQNIGSNGGPSQNYPLVWRINKYQTFLNILKRLFWKVLFWDPLLFRIFPNDRPIDLQSFSFHRRYPGNRFKKLTAIAAVITFTNWSRRCDFLLNVCI